MLAPGQHHTVRTPDRDGNSNDTRLDTFMKDQAQSLSNAMYILLNQTAPTQLHTWDQFANHWVDKVPIGNNPPRWRIDVSLESWHDNIHGLVGSGDRTSGHMSAVPVAAVSPAVP
jgi:hypothetical protein